MEAKKELCKLSEAKHSIIDFKFVKNDNNEIFIYIKTQKQTYSRGAIYFSNFKTFVKHTNIKSQIIKNKRIIIKMFISELEKRSFKPEISNGFLSFMFNVNINFNQGSIYEDEIKLSIQTSDFKCCPTPQDKEYIYILDLIINGSNSEFYKTLINLIPSS
jgi:hypothetical protein